MIYPLVIFVLSRKWRILDLTCFNIYSVRISTIACNLRDTRPHLYQFTMVFHLNKLEMKPPLLRSWSKKDEKTLEIRSSLWKHENMGSSDFSNFHNKKTKTSVDCFRPATLYILQNDELFRTWSCWIKISRILYNIMFGNFFHCFLFESKFNILLPFVIISHDKIS